MNQSFGPPRFALHIRNWSLPGAKRFLSVVQDPSILEEVAKFITETLFDNQHPPPEVRSITIAITSHEALSTMQAAAFHSASDLDSVHHMIEIGEPYLATIDAGRLHDEVLGLCLHEMVHCFHARGNKECPQGLIEGLADWVRLRRGLAPPHWEASISSRWDAGYDTTAYFLEHLERAYGTGTVARINSMACSSSYRKSDWEDLFGKDVEALWQEYCTVVKAKEKI